MRIRTQLFLAAACAGGIAFAVFAALWYGTQRNTANLQSQRDSQDIVRNVASLLTLTQEYTAYGGERATGQWHARHAQLMQTVEQALAREPTARADLVEVRERARDLLPLYDRLEKAYRDGGSELAQRRRELMVERLVSETQELIEALHRWSTAIIEQHAYRRGVYSAIVLAASGVLVLLIVGVALLVDRRGLVPLARLQAATAAIERGDLSVRCDASARNEVGDTGRAVNAMAESLLAANAALRESQERYELAVAGSDDGVFDWDYRSGRAFGSARARELLGLPAEQELQSTAAWFASVEQHLHPDDVPRRRAAIEAHMAGRTSTYEGEFRVRNPDGSDRWVRIRGLCIRDAQGTPYRMAGSISDIDARKRAEVALRRSEERYARAMEGSNEAHWDWNLETGEQYLSPRVIEMYGLPPDGYTTREQFLAAFAIHPEDRPRWQEALQAHIAGLAPRFEVEYRVTLRSGEQRWLHVRGQCFRSGDDQATHLTGSTSDITDRKTAEAERERLEAQLRQAQKLEAMGTLAGGIAHDFNNILAAILGYGEMVQKDAVEGTALRRHIDAAMSAALRAKSLVERILAFSRSGMGERMPVHVQWVVAETLDQLAASLPAKVALARELDAGDAAVLGDPTQVHQVVMNLCTNGAQAMKGGGTLTVSVAAFHCDAALALTTSVLAPGDYVRLRVRDTGTGIRSDIIERIFDPFFSTKGVGAGTGLGLSLVHGIVADMHGGVDVDSEVGAGTTFTVYLPCEGVAPAPTVLESVVPEGGGETILLVDDEEALVHVGEEMLARLGYEPVGFTSSIAALESIRATPQRYHAALLDEAMPNLTGSELALQIRAVRPDLPIVLMSGYVTPVLAARAQEARVAEVLAKPLVSADIARSLAGALQADSVAGTGLRA